MDFIHRGRAVSFLSALVLGLVSSAVSGAGVCPGTSCDGPAELPRSYVDTKFSTNFPDNFASYITKTVCASGCDYNNLQSALNAIVSVGGNVSGEVIRLAAGQTFTGNFNLPALTMAPGKWIVLRTDTADSNLPAEGVRIDPSYSPKLAKIYASGNGRALQIANQANHYWIMGLEIAAAPSVTFNDGAIIAVGTGPSQVAQLPSDIVVDRCYVHGNSTGEFKRGVQADGINVAIINSYFENFHSNNQGASFDTQTIASWNTTGPLKIVNNFLEAAGENILFGGSKSQLPSPIVPSDIEIRFNHFFKRLSWYVNSASYQPPKRVVKNTLEFKFAQRVLLEGNILENSWGAGQGQVGFSIVITPRGQAGAMPWATVADLTIRHNIIRRSASGIEIAGGDNTGASDTSQRISVHDNFFDDINGTTWGGDGYLFEILVANPPTPHDIEITHNTGFQSDQILLFGSAPTNKMTGFVYANNIHPFNRYGVMSGSGGGAGAVCLQNMSTNPVFEGNVLEAPFTPQTPSSYPPGNYFPATWPVVQFTDFAGGDFRLASGSPYKGQATDAAARQAMSPPHSSDIGADMDAVILYTCYAVTGDPSSSCTTLPPSSPPPSSGQPGTNPPPGAEVAPIPTPVVRPNPWRSDRYSVPSITFDQMPAGGSLKIFTVSGHLVKEIPIAGSSLTWDLTNASGQRVASGVYIYLVTDGAGQKVRGKLALIK